MQSLSHTKADCLRRFADKSYELTELEMDSAGIQSKAIDGLLHGNIGRDLSVILEVIVKLDATFNHIQIEVRVRSRILVKLFGQVVSHRVTTVDGKLNHALAKGNPRDCVDRNSALYRPFASVIPMDGRTFASERLDFDT